MLDPRLPDLLRDALARLDAGFATLPAFESAQPRGSDAPALAATLAEVATRLHDNYPYPHPLYAGQMLKPPHPVAHLAYALAQTINPNNHALDGGRASSAMEREAVAQLAAMVGWTAPLGHLTGGGTMANLEALWVAGRLAPGKVVLASGQAHYTHERISGVLGLPFESVPCDASGRLDAAALAQRLARGDVGTVVATLGTTAVGAVDPLPEILALRERWGFRLHVDAAYGGYFGLISEALDPPTRAAFARLGEVDSVVIDPHKHGLQPYGCGCVLFADASVGALYRHDSPYTYFTSEALHLGEISLECSRAGAAAVALWATQRLLPPVPGGEFAAGLARSRRAAQHVAAALRADPRRWRLSSFDPELDIVVWLPRAADAAGASARSRRVFEAAARGGLHLALAQLPAAFFGLEGDARTVTCLRSVLMKPEHLDWADAILERLNTAWEETEER